MAPYMETMPSATDFIKEHKDIFQYKMDKNNLWIKFLNTKENHYLSVCTNKDE